MPIIRCPYCGEMEFECQSLYYEDGKEEPAGHCWCNNCGKAGLFCPNAKGIPGYPGIAGKDWPNASEILTEIFEPIEKIKKSKRMLRLEDKK